MTYTLSDNVENLTLTGINPIDGTGNNLNNRLIGNSANNTLTGGEGNDNLDGKAGNDTMIGGLGNDIYTVDSTEDVVIENANEGTDTINSSVTYNLSNNIENLTLTGTNSINGTGNDFANTIIGNNATNILTGGGGNDVLNGKGGDDILVGGFGNDTLTGGIGADRFVFNNLSEGIDRITDLIAGTDKIVLSGQGFGISAITDIEFTTGSVTADTRLIYNPINGNLVFDPDGSGSDLGVQLAILTTRPVLSASDFILG